MTGDGHEDGWQEWSKHVLKELERQNEWLASIQKAITAIQIDVAILKLKAGAWGALGGLIAVAVALAVGWLHK